ncbi:MAG TPA: serine hydroxymethyltransferase [bacterium]|nr:serine hydroxymethyltransferase [bacterium]
MEIVKEVDPEIYEAIMNEEHRQLEKLELIASENFVSEAVRQAQSCVMTHKYAEGIPGKRYYGGCEFVDVAERLARSRAMSLFGADYANVQPHSGAQANMAVYMAVMKPGDKMLGLSLTCGGHLTHGSPVNFSGKLYNVVPYGVNRQTEQIDFDEVERLALEHRPKLIEVGGSAYPRTLDFARFREIADEVGAVVMADIAHIAGLVVAGEHPSPVPHCQFITTTTHKTLRGPRGGIILCTKSDRKLINRSVFPGVQGGPLMHVIASKAVALKEAATDSYREYIGQVVKNATSLAKTLMDRGYRLVSGGTDTHLMLVDVSAKGMTGKDAEEWLDKANITCNKNTVPFETESPFITSGIRLGTPALTTRGMKEPEMEKVGEFIADVLDSRGDEGVVARVGKQVKELTSGFPLYAH